MANQNRICAWAVMKPRPKIRSMYAWRTPDALKVGLMPSIAKHIHQNVTWPRRSWNRAIPRNSGIAE